MPISEYILLALLATGGIAVTDGNGTSALGAEAIAQPNGAASSAAEVGNRREPKKEGGNRITATKPKDTADTSGAQTKTVAPHGRLRATNLGTTSNHTLKE